MHGVDLGQTYRNCDSACNFVHYIAESQRQDFHHQLSSCHFYSMLMDGSVDKGQVENELMVILYCNRDDTSQEMKTCAQYYSVLEPARSDANGLIECLGKALKSMGIDDLLSRENVLGVSGYPLLIGCGNCLGYSGSGAMLIDLS